MRWNVGLEVRNSAWVRWRKTTVEAADRPEAERLALKWCADQTGQWTLDHHDHCPQDWQFTVIGCEPASERALSENDRRNMLNPWDEAPR